MKFQSLLSIAALLCALTIFSSCKNDSAAAKDAAAENAAPQPDEAGSATMMPAPAGDPLSIDPLSNTVTPAADAPKTEPAQNAAGVWHYTCSKGCAGGGASATACAKCGNTLAHNSAYHGTPNPSATTATPSTSSTPSKSNTITMPDNPKPEPAQNAAGVWHYTCADGHAGGAGSAAPCATCSKPMVHNKAYHDK
ncbi:MAG: hypothetical protein ACKVUS_00180 [Saprospiraceae bacterium]